MLQSNVSRMFKKSIMQVRRDREFGDNFYVGAVKRVYGKKTDGSFICPLDICFYHVDPNNNQDVETGAGDGAFLSYSVSSAGGGGSYGNISKYSLPNSNGTLLDVNPIVEIKPTDSVKRRFEDMPDITQDAIVQPKENDEVRLQYFNPISMTWQAGTNKGIVKKPQQKWPYLNNSYRLDAYLVEFQKDIVPSDIGTRVVPFSGEGVIGMLVTVKDLLQPRGAECLVYPASKIK